MAETSISESIPLVIGADGSMRVRGTRLMLDTIVTAFAEGATPEEIAQQYPSASLADIYQVIGYSLQHSAELESYFDRRQQETDKTRKANELRWPPAGVRDRLLARRRT